jgi:hypothetical protein
MWGSSPDLWTGNLVLIEHYPAAETFTAKDELDQVVIGIARFPPWRRIHPDPEDADRAEAVAWMETHGRAVIG